MQLVTKLRFKKSFTRLDDHYVAQLVMKDLHSFLSLHSHTLSGSHSHTLHSGFFFFIIYKVNFLRIIEKAFLLYVLQ